MKTLIMLSAIPASGKSTWAKAYQKEHPNTYIVSSDQIRIDLTGCYDDRSRQNEVWQIFADKIHEYGKNENCTVILDALNDLNILREKYVKENPEFDKYILVTFPCDPDRSRFLNSQRVDDLVPPEVLEILINKFEEPTEEIKDLFDEIWEIRWKDRILWKVMM